MSYTWILKTTKDETVIYVIIFSHTQTNLATCACVACTLDATKSLSCMHITTVHETSWKHIHKHPYNPASRCLTLQVCLPLFPPSSNGSVVKPCISPIRPGSIPLNRWRVLSQQALVRSRVRPQRRSEKETLTILRLEAALFLLVVWLTRERPRLNKSPQLSLATF